MAAPLIQMPVRYDLDLIPDHPQGSGDVIDLAVVAAEHLEQYMRAPWRRLNEKARMGHLRTAIALLQRAEGLETGRIPMPVFGG